MTTYLVPWSGGVDSTGLVLHLLREGHQVSTCYINILNNKEKIEEETKAIQNILPILMNFSNFGEHNGNIADIMVQCSFNWFLPQPVTWMYALSAYASAEHYDSIAMGYVVGDDALDHLDDMRALWKAFSSFVYDGLPTLEFPFANVEKTHIWNEILDDRFRKYVHWCQDFHYQGASNPCGECTPCEKMIQLGLWGKRELLMQKASKRICEGA